MVSKTFQRNRVFSWNLNFETAQEAGVWYVYYYDTNGVDMYKIALDADTKTQAQALIAQIKAWMDSSDTWSGTVVETWRKQVVVHPETQVEEWVKQ